MREGNEKTVFWNPDVNEIAGLLIPCHICPQILDICSSSDIRSPLRCHSLTIQFVTLRDNQRLVTPVYVLDQKLISIFFVRVEACTHGDMLLRASFGPGKGFLSYQNSSGSLMPVKRSHLLHCLTKSSSDHQLAPNPFGQLVADRRRSIPPV